MSSLLAIPGATPMKETGNGLSRIKWHEAGAVLAFMATSPVSGTVFSAFTNS
jgi:hypothetical protein